MARRDGREERTGGALIWKPRGISSRTALERAEHALGIAPLGHTGTLDPLAEGLLLLLGGEARKFQALLTDHTKSYVATVTFGVVSGSEDAEGPLSCPLPPVETPGRDAIERALGTFRGGYDQVPPRHSAVRVDGQRAWKRARRGEEVTMASRPVSIDRLEILEVEGDECRLAVDCGPGTYIRSLARDIGEALGCGAFLSALSRTRIGAHGAEGATELDALGPDAWWPLEKVLEGIPAIDVSPEASARLAHGQRVALENETDAPAPANPCVVRCEGRVVGLGEVRGRVIQPRRWLRGDRAS